MKKIIFIFAYVAFTLVSCEKHEILNETIEPYNYESEISQNRISLANGLIDLINSDKEFSLSIINECNKMFDGDRNVLFKDLILLSIDKKPISMLINNSTSVKKVKSANNFSNYLLESDSLVQIYYYIANGNDSTSFDGIVIKPAEYQEGEKRTLMVIKLDGSIDYVRTDIDPDENYLVISENQRYDYINNGSQKASKVILADGKSMKITRAKFTSISAKRTVEAWIDGEPEVRLNIGHVFLNPITYEIIEARNSSYLYVKDWIKNGVFKNDVKWNNMVVECPYWSINEKVYGRRLRWTEEDGTATAINWENHFPNKDTGITTTLTVQIPATNKDVVFADGWIDYDDLGSSKTYTWGIITFDIVCE